MSNSVSTGQHMCKWPEVAAICKNVVIQGFKMKRRQIHNPIQLWNNSQAAPFAQALHSDGVYSVIVPLSKDGCHLDFLALDEKQKFVRVQVCVPLGKAIMFSGSVFHAGSPGTNGKANAALHFNIDEDGNNNNFKHLFLYQFNMVGAKNYFKQGNTDVIRGR